MPAELRPRRVDASACPPSSRRVASATTARGRRCSSDAVDAEAPWRVARRRAVDPRGLRCRSSGSSRSLRVRGTDGSEAFYPLIENHHGDGILRLESLAGPRLSARHPGERAFDMRRRVLGALDYVGVLALELFEAGARCSRTRWRPRVHNSWPLDDRGRGDEPVREPPPRHRRAAARLDRGARARAPWST